ncbi:methylmalonyl-CoA epimerase [Bacillus sp. AFS017336]|nr:methylmalonyl-CoA epimerase [Bacillus sp. AFS017336]
MYVIKASVKRRGQEMFTNIDHMAICVKDLNESIKKYEAELGLSYSYREIVNDQGVEIAFFESKKINIELIQPLTTINPVHKYIEKKGEGLHHIAFQVDDIEKSLNELKKRQFSLINHSPRNGTNGSKAVFIHPKQFGMLIEIVQNKGEV